MKTKILKCTGLLIGLIFVFSLFPQSAAAVVWSDNFDDGNYDGWTVTGGSFTVTDGQLEVATMNGEYPALIEHQSNVTMGTWSFDIHIGDEATLNWVFVHFMKDEPDYFFGVAMELEFFAATVTLNRISSTIPTEIDDWVNPGGIYRQAHIDVTHNETNYFYVYVNGSLAFETAGIVPYHLTFDYFAFGGSTGSTFDNLIVTEYVEPIPSTTTTPPDTTTTTTGDTTPPPAPIDMTTMLIIAGGGIAVVVVIVIIVKMRP